MADPKNKYSDPELNPGNKDYEESINHPVGGERDGDAVAHDLSRSEEGLGPIQKRLQRRDNKQQAAREAEAAEWNDPENRFGYKPEGKGDAKVSGSTKRKNAIRLGVGGGIIGLVFAMFGMLLPLKIPGIMQMISDEAGQRVEQITERRAKIIIARAIFQKFATSGSGIVVTGDGPVGTLIASMRVNNFEKKLADKGLTIEKSGDGVKLRTQGGYLSIKDGDVTKVIMGDEYQVLMALDGSPHGRALLREIVKEEIPSWRWMKRAKFAKWLRIKYGIPRYGIENSNKADDVEVIKEMNETRLGPEYEAVAENADNAINDLIEGNGDLDPYDPEVSGGGDSNLGDDTREAASEAASENSDPKNATTTNLIEKLSAKIATKAIPVIGWIDFAAMANHIVYETSENDLIGKISSYYRALQYSRHFGVWSGYGSQIQLGAMNPAFIGVLATQTDGIEESEAFNMIEGNLNAGVKVKNKINANNPTAISANVKEYTEYVGGYDSIQGKAVNVVLEAWYDVSNAIFGSIGEALGAAADFITPEAAEEYLAKYISKALGKIMALIGLDFDPMVKGADWFNAAHGGATWTYNDFCKVEMGCRKLSPQQAHIQNSIIAAERSDYTKQQGLSYALLSPENSNSFVSQLAVNTPTSTTSTLAKLSRVITNSPSTFIGMITGKTSAAGYTDIHGVDPYGATEADLNQPLAEQAINGDECPEVPEDAYNGCLVDTTVAEAMVCDFITDSEECNDGSGLTTTPTGEGSEFTVASYNILHSVHHTDKSITIGGCGANPVPGDPRCMKTRGDRQVKIITGKFGNPVFDIFGTQETSPEQYEYLKKNLPGYAAFPESTERMNNYQDGAVAIFWNTAKFTLAEKGKARGKSNTSEYISNPWVGLKANSGQMVYVMSIHYAIDGFGGTPESIRESSNLTMDWVKSKATDDNIVIVVGDFNDRLPEHHYCIYTKKSAMQHAVDMSAGAPLNEGCTKRRFGGIDHIYATPSLGLTARNWKSMPDNGEVAKASDHVPVYTTYTIPSTGSGSSEGWVWPLKTGLKPGPCYKSTSTGRVHAGMDINSDSTTDPVLAMHDGTIVSTSSGDDAGNSIIVKSTDGKFYWYQHLSSVTKTSGSVKAGEPLGVIGATGNVRISSASHLHITVFTKAGDYPSYGSLQSSIDPMSVLPKPAPGGYKCTP